MEDVRPKLEVTRSETRTNDALAEDPVPRTAQERVLEERFVRALRAWDVHVGTCHECLGEGLHLCAEGIFVYDDVEEARGRIELLETRRSSRAARLPIGSVRPGFFGRLDTVE